MKLLFIALVIAINCNAQNDSIAPLDTIISEPYYIKKCTDIMSGKKYVFGSKKLICSEDGKTGFSIRISWDDKNGLIKYSGLSLVHVNIGNCSENDKLIILFEDDSKIELTSWQSFNCEGNSYFDFANNKFGSLNTKKIKAIRFTNGKSFDSYTYKIVNEDEATFFIQAKKALLGNNIKEVSCDD